MKIQFSHDLPFNKRRCSFLVYFPHTVKFILITTISNCISPDDRQRESVKVLLQLISLLIQSTMQHFIDLAGALELINPLGRTITFRSVVGSCNFRGWSILYNYLTLGGYHVCFLDPKLNLIAPHRPNYNTKDCWPLWPHLCQRRRLSWLERRYARCNWLIMKSRATPAVCDITWYRMMKASSVQQWGTRGAPDWATEK
jgi:hypothetical protein